VKIKATSTVYFYLAAIFHSNYQPQGYRLITDRSSFGATNQTLRSYPSICCVW